MRGLFSKRLTAARIKIAREDMGMTVPDVACYCGVTRKSVSDWESEKSVPRGDRIFCLSKLLGVSADWLLGLE